jgi:eukaryotic-like serine/threonine-protein kinase
VIHRDLKPSNVLATVTDDTPLCKVIDFGIAKAVAVTAEDASRLTQVDQSPGTPAYMSPEQISSGGDIDTRSDIYSLGVLLYELLAGALPFESQAYRGAAFHVQHLVQDAPALSDRFAGLDEADQARIAEARRVDPAGLRRQLRGDLGWVVMRALERDRDRRYETANGLAADLDRFLANEPVAAGPPGRAYRAGKFVRRHRAGVAFVRDLAVTRQAQAENLIGFMVGDLRAKLAPVGRLDILDDVGQRALAYFAAVPEAALSAEELFRRAETVRQLGEVRLEQGNLEAAAEAFDKALALAQLLGQRDARNPEWQVALGAAYFWVGYVAWLQDDLDGALAAFLPYREISERLVERDRGNREWLRELGHAHSNLGSVQEARGDLLDAVASLRATLATREQLIATDPEDRDARFDLAIAHNKIAVVLQKMGDFDEAAVGFRHELAIKQDLVAANPDDVPLREHLGIAHAFVAAAALLRGDVESAVPHFEDGLELFRWLVVRDPGNDEWRTGLANRLSGLGEAYGFAGSFGPAVATLEEAAATFEGLLAGDPSPRRLRRGLAVSRHRLGRVYLEAGDPAGALAPLSAAVALLEGLLEEAPADRLSRAGLGEALLLAGDARLLLGDPRASTDWARARQVLEPLTDGATEVQSEGLWAAALMRTRDPKGDDLVLSLRERGYRHPAFVRLTGPAAPAAGPGGSP